MSEHCRREPHKTREIRNYAVVILKNILWDVNGR